MHFLNNFLPRAVFADDKSESIRGTTVFFATIVSLTFLVLSVTAVGISGIVAGLRLKTPLEENRITTIRIPAPIKAQTIA